MRLPLIVTLLGYAGLLPFVAGPAWLTFAPATAPAWLDPFWINYVTLLAAFLAGTFWGFALPAVQGPAGMLGIFIASMLMLLTWLAMSLAFGVRLYALAVVFLLLLIADFWRERTLDTLPGYFALRSTLTVGAIATIAWRIAMSNLPG
jgi:hypothetical protein